MSAWVLFLSFIPFRQGHIVLGSSSRLCSVAGGVGFWLSCSFPGLSDLRWAGLTHRPLCFGSHFRLRNILAQFPLTSESELSLASVAYPVARSPKEKWYKDDWCFRAEVIPMTHHIGLLFNYRVRVWQGIPLVQRQGRGVHPTGNNASVMAVGAVWHMEEITLGRESYLLPDPMVLFFTVSTSLVLLYLCWAAYQLFLFYACFLLEIKRREKRNWGWMKSNILISWKLIVISDLKRIIRVYWITRKCDHPWPYGAGIVVKNSAQCEGRENNWVNSKEGIFQNYKYEYPDRNKMKNYEIKREWILF